MKDIIETVIVFVLVVLSTIFVISTRGSSTLDLKGINWGTIEREDTFDYDLVPDSLNGEYRNNKGNNMYAMVGKNADGTYRIYIIHVGNASFTKGNRNIVVRLDGAQLDANGSCTFTTSNDAKMKLRISEKTLYITADYSIGDASLEGMYIWRKDISRFALNELQLYTK